MLKMSKYLILASLLISSQSFASLSDNLVNSTIVNNTGQEITLYRYGSGRCVHSQNYSKHPGSNLPLTIKPGDSATLTYLADTEKDHGCSSSLMDSGIEVRLNVKGIDYERFYVFYDCNLPPEWSYYQSYPKYAVSFTPGSRKYNIVSLFK